MTISNGTAFGDVYGNNVTNQSLQNAWDVPSIPTPIFRLLQNLVVVMLRLFFILKFLALLHLLILVM